MRVVLVGAGGWGKNHARVLSQLDALCAICDADVNTSMKLGNKYAVNHYTSVDELIKLEKFDAAVIATPTKSHFEIAKKLIEAKKHIFVEKPITIKSDKGQILVDFANRKKTNITCGYIERFNPAVNKVKSYIEKGKYGDLLTLEFHRYNTTPPNTQDIGIIHDTAVHDIDTANYLFGQTPIVIFARAGSINHKHENYANIMLGYKNNKTAVISTSWISSKKIRTLRAVCTKNTFTADFLSQTVNIDAEQNISSKWQEPLLLEMKSFLDSTNSVIPPQQAVNVTRIAEAALLSSQKGIPIYLELK